MLENVKVNDKLWIQSHTSGGVGIVKRITPKGWIVVAYGKGEVTFRPNGQERTSDPWHWRTARPLTEEDVTAMQLESLRLQVRRAIEGQIGNLTMKQCQEIWSIITREGE